MHEAPHSSAAEALASRRFQAWRGSCGFSRRDSTRRALLVEGLDGRRRAPPAGHPDLPISLRWMVFLSPASSLAGIRRTLGEGHFCTPMLMRQLARTLRARGRGAEAELFLSEPDATEPDSWPGARLQESGEPWRDSVPSSQ